MKERSELKLWLKQGSSCCIFYSVDANVQTGKWYNCPLKKKKTFFLSLTSRFRLDIKSSRSLCIMYFWYFYHFGTQKSVKKFIFWFLNSYHTPLHLYKHHKFSAPSAAQWVQTEKAFEDTQLDVMQPCYTGRSGCQSRFIVMCNNSMCT